MGFSIGHPKVKGPLPLGRKKKKCEVMLALFMSLKQQKKKRVLSSLPWGIWDHQRSRVLCSDPAVRWPSLTWGFMQLLQKGRKTRPGGAETCQTQRDFEINISADKIRRLFVCATYKTFMGKGPVECPYFPVFVQGENRAVCRCQTLCQRLRNFRNLRKQKL